MGRLRPDPEDDLRNALGVYLVSRPVPDPPEGPGLPALAARAVAGGVGIVQVREKDADTARRRSLALAVRERCPGALVVVNDDLEAAAAVDGVHVGPDDAPPTLARERLGPEAVVGWSLHDRAQLDDLDALRACSYLAAAPVWPTASKPGHTEPWGLDGVRWIVAALAERGLAIPVIGIGGVDAGNAAEVVRAGAVGVAVISAILDADDPAAAAGALRAAVSTAVSTASTEDA